MSEQLRKAAQEFLWTAEQYRSAHYNGTHMTADGTAAWAIREREFKAKDAALREALLAAAPSTPEPDADGFMMMHNAGRHDVACKWSRPGIIDASVDPCTCGLAEDIAAILASTPEPGIEHDCEWRRQVDDADETSAKLSQRLLRCQDELRAARLASKDRAE